jgi:hypothetical protein
MRHYKEAAQSGNNISSKKFFRVTVPLVSEINPTNVIQGKYFFPENKTLTNVQINGVQLHYGNNDIALKANVQYSNFVLWFANPAIFNTLNAFITLFDSDGIEIMYNAPTSNFYNAGTGFSKIIPLNCKLNLKKSYILVPEPYTSTPPIIPAYTMTFFYD